MEHSCTAENRDKVQELRGEMNERKHDGQFR